MRGTYRYPGTGAVTFAIPYVKGLTEEEAIQVIRSLMKGELHDPDDKRIKRCGYCGYFYRDKTKPNMSKTCCKPCKIASDTLKRRQKRADEALLKPKKQTRREEYYIHWLEYPFWLHEYEMLKQSWKQERPYSLDKINQIHAAKLRDEHNGGKKKPKRVVPYNGDEKEQPKVSVRYTKSNTKPGEVIETRMNSEEIDHYLVVKYTDRHLRLERRRAIRSRKF